MNFQALLLCPGIVAAHELDDYRRNNPLDRRARPEEIALPILFLCSPWTQVNLGAALQTLGARASGTARLNEAVAAYRDALKEWTRERVPLDWAMTQNNLGIALMRLGERESGTARLEARLRPIATP
jgi:hypothetical protein